jgi:hypothetical protein
MLIEVPFPGVHLIPTEPVPSKSTPVAAFVTTGSYAPNATAVVDDTEHFAATDAVMLSDALGELAANSGVAAIATAPAATADKYRRRFFITTSKRF